MTHAECHSVICSVNSVHQNKAMGSDALIAEDFPIWGVRYGSKVMDRY